MSINKKRLFILSLFAGICLTVAIFRMYSNTPEPDSVENKSTETAGKKVTCVCCRRQMPYEEFIAVAPNIRECPKCRKQFPEPFLIGQLAVDQKRR